MFKLYIILVLFSFSLSQSVLQESRCSSDYSLKSNRRYENSRTWLEDDSHESYLEICYYIQREASALLWKPVCGGRHWTNNEARVACNQLGYPNTTTLATTRGLCSNPNNISDGVEVTGCSGTEIHFGMCQSSTANCNLWAGIICTSLEFCSDEICSNMAYCHPTPTCSNCSIPQELNCICYGECNPPCMNGGSCVYNKICQCLPYWTGQHCEQSLVPTTDNNIDTETASPIRNVSTCHMACLNQGNSNSDENCVCTPEHTLQQHNKEEFSILYIIIAILATLLIFSVLTIVALIAVVLYSRIHKMQSEKEQFQQTAKEKCHFEEAALTANPSYGVHAPLTESNNNNVTLEEHPNEQRQLGLNLMQVGREETEDINQKAADDYYTTILDI